MADRAAFTASAVPSCSALHEGRKLRIERRPSGDDVVHPWTDHDGGRG